MSLPKPYVGCIIQARLTSTRLPRKHLLGVNGKPLLEHLVNRVQASKYIDKVVIAAPHSPECCLDIDTFIGSETDVLDRYYQAAKKYNFDIIVRITADCPCIPIYEINRCVKRFLDGGTHYVTNVGAHNERFGTPDGWDVEVFDMAALETAWEETDHQYEREHVTVFMKNNPGFHPVYLDPLKLSVDTQEDFNVVQEYMRLEYPSLTTETTHGLA